MQFDGDDDNAGTKKAQSDPVEPSSLELPQDTDSFLGSEHDKAENKQLL